MTKHRRQRFAISGFLLILLVATGLRAQEQTPSLVRQPRVLAPGVETIVTPQILAAERRAMPQIYGLEIAYKPPRFIAVDIPSKIGQVRKKRIWYLAYRVTNRSGKPRMFVPEFNLISTDTNKRYVDKIIPTAQKAIARREDPALDWNNSASIVGMIPVTPERGPSVSVYGIATWEDVDPKTDFFTIYITGLSNGYKINSDANHPRRHLRKTLKIDFWRPGDDLFENEKEIIPRGSEWIYR